MNGQFLGSQLPCHPDFRIACGIRESARHHADDRVPVRVKSDLPAQNPRIGGESAYPESVAYDGYVRRSGSIVIHAKVTAQKRADAEHRKQIRRHRLPDEMFWAAFIAEIKVVPFEGGHIVEDMISRSPVGEVTRSGSVPGESVGRAVFPDHHEPASVAVGKRPQQDGVGNAENRRVRRDAQREDAHGKKSETRTLAEYAHGIPQILPNAFEPADAVHAINLLADESRITQLPPRCVTRLFGKHASCNVLVRLHLEVRFELTRPLFIPRAAPEKTCPSHRPTPKPAATRD